MKCRALLASKDATLAVITEAQWESKERTRNLDQTRGVDQPKATHDHSTTRAEYWVETWDIRVVRECENSGQQDSNETSSRQNQLDKLQPDKGSKNSAFKQNREQSQCGVQDVHLKDRDQRCIELLRGVGASRLGQQIGHDQKKTIGLQEY